MKVDWLPGAAVDGLGIENRFGSWLPIPKIFKFTNNCLRIKIIINKKPHTKFQEGKLYNLVIQIAYPDPEG